MLRRTLAWLMMCVVLAGNLLAVAHAHEPGKQSSLIQASGGNAVFVDDGERGSTGVGKLALCDVCGHTLTNGLTATTVTRVPLPPTPQVADFRASASPTRAFTPPDRPPK